MILFAKPRISVRGRLAMPVDISDDDPIQDLMPLLIDLQGKLHEGITLETLAQQFGCSRFHFHRVFSGTLGETPKRHVHRLRLERVAYMLAITNETVLSIALDLGFKNHETLSRSFKRAFGLAPLAYRRACRLAQAERLERNTHFRGSNCRLSDVTFVTLPAETLLAIRRYGPYENCPIPFQEEDRFWTNLVRWAQRKRIAYRPSAWAISYDDPTVTPGSLQRLDACIPIEGIAAPNGRVRRLDFAGGRYGRIEHTGPLATIIQAYRHLADGIRRSRLYEFDKGPPVQIYRAIHVGGDSSGNLTEVYFPTRRKT
jgi:AraC family transcriptional regulator